MGMRFEYKKVLSTIFAILIFSMQTLPALATDTIYDFSDEAQAQFDTQMSTVQSELTEEQASTEKSKKEKKKKKKKKKKNKKKTNKKQEQSNEILQEIVQEPVNSVNPNSIPVFQPEIQTEQSLSNTTLKGNIVYIPAGATFQGVLQSSISSASLSKNDTIAAVLHSDWYYNNVLIAPQGSILYGTTVDTQKAGFAYGNGRISITFNEIITPKGDSIKLESNVVTIAVESKRAKKIASNVIGGALIGIATGGLSALLRGGDNISRALAIGAAAGGLGGVIRAAANKGEEVEIPAGTSIDIRLTKPMNVAPYK